MYCPSLGAIEPESLVQRLRRLTDTQLVHITTEGNPRARVAAGEERARRRMRLLTDAQLAQVGASGNARARRAAATEQLRRGGAPTTAPAAAITPAAQRGLIAAAVPLALLFLGR